MSLRPYVHVDADLLGRGAGDEVALDGEAQRHLRTVLRLPTGAACHLADGAGNHAPAELGERSARLTAPAVAVPPPRPRLVVAQALAKGRKFDDVVRVGTELGADAFLPVTAARSITRLDGKTDKVVARWAAVGRAAAEQARRPHRPSVSAPVRVAEVADGGDAVVLVAHPGCPGLHLRAELAEAREVVLAVGPEGGWTEVEVEQFVSQGAHLVGLGPNVLRTEHAAAAGLAVLNAVTGRWDAQE